METSWTPERVKLLDELWAAGYSASIIADQLGGTTRNAVIGKVHRCGLAMRTTSKEHRAPRKKYVRTQLTVHGKHHHVANVVLQEPVVEIIDSEIPVKQRLNFEQLTNFLCKYPVGTVGEPGFFFCGAPIKEASQYCAGHHARCHTKDREGRWFSFTKLF